MYINRLIEKAIRQDLFDGQVQIIYGARQVGKTTMVKKILADFKNEGLYLQGDSITVQNALRDADAKRMNDFFGAYKIIVIDEAQTIPNIGLSLKVFHDAFPKTQIIATGSSSFSLANQIGEPLVGRAHWYNLYPLSLQELRQEINFLEIDSGLEKILRFGLYPAVYPLDDQAATRKLEEILTGYLYKDILSLDGIRKPAVVKNLLTALALQVGNEVSYNELANLLGVNVNTVQKYLDVLEQCFVIFTLRAFSRNPRKEIAKSFKVYFYDLGIRNALIQNFNPLSFRNDIGPLWENFCVMERLKKNQADNRMANLYFWRSYSRNEIDFLEEREGKLFAYEFKWENEKLKKMTEFMTSYPGSEVALVNRSNYDKFLIL